MVKLGDFKKDDLLYSFVLLEHFLVFTGLKGPIDLQKLFSMASLAAFKFLHETEAWFLPDFSKLV